MAARFLAVLTRSGSQSKIKVIAAALAKLRRKLRSSFDKSVERSGREKRKREEEEEDVPAGEAPAKKRTFGSSHNPRGAHIFLSVHHFQASKLQVSTCPHISWLFIASKIASISFETLLRRISMHSYCSGCVNHLTDESRPPQQAKSAQAMHYSQDEDSEASGELGGRESIPSDAETCGRSRRAC